MKFSSQSKAKSISSTSDGDSCLIKFEPLHDNQANFDFNLYMGKGNELLIKILSYLPTSYKLEVLQLLNLRLVSKRFNKVISTQFNFFYRLSHQLASYGNLEWILDQNKPTVGAVMKNKKIMLSEFTTNNTETFRDIVIYPLLTFICYVSARGARNDPKWGIALDDPEDTTPIEKFVFFSIAFSGVVSYYPSKNSEIIL